MRKRSHRRLVARRGPALAWLRLPSRAQACFTLLALVAVLIQSLAVQTHIHHPAQTATISGALVSADASGASHPPARGDDDSSNCALCQAFTHAGTFLHSASLSPFIVVTASLRLNPFAEPLPVRFALSHNWQGRAPPLI